MTYQKREGAKWRYNYNPETSDDADMDRRQFTLDGEPVGIYAFFADNELDRDEMEAIHALPINGELTFGGGAFATFILKRTEDKQP